VLLVYSDADERRAGVASWVRRGLESGAKILYLEPAADDDQSFMNALAQEHDDVTPALERGQVQLVAPPRSGVSASWLTDVVGQALSTLGKGIAPALITRARQMGVQLPAELNDPQADLPPRLIVTVLRQIAGHLFPLLAADAKDAG